MEQESKGTEWCGIKSKEGRSDPVQEEKHLGQVGGKAEKVNNVVMAGIMESFFFFFNGLNFFDGL